MLLTKNVTFVILRNAGGFLNACRTGAIVPIFGYHHKTKTPPGWVVFLDGGIRFCFCWRAVCRWSGPTPRRWTGKIHWGNTLWNSKAQFPGTMRIQPVKRWKSGLWCGGDIQFCWQHVLGHGIMYNNYIDSHTCSIYDDCLNIRGYDTGVRGIRHIPDLCRSRKNCVRMIHKRR